MKVVRALIVALASCLALAGGAVAEQVRDTLPFRIVHGRPEITPSDETLVYFWFQGGRLKLRVPAADRRGKVQGELRTGNGGQLEDVAPLTENLRIRQPRPGKLLFDVRLAGVEEGLDVTIGGDFTQVTIDLLVDGERRPAALRIGEKRQSPSALPARLELRNADSSWLERFGF